jgi:hypothetical protein
MGKYNTFIAHLQHSVIQSKIWSRYTFPPGPEREVIETQLGNRWNQQDEPGR